MTDYLEHKIDFNSPAIASVVDELSFWSSRFGALLFRHIELRSHIKILDVGCATGFPLFELAHVYGRSCQVMGIDIWKEALKRARRKLDVYNLPNVRVVEADGARQPFPDSTFDLIVSNLGINNWEVPQGVLAECYRVASPDAALVLTTNLVGHYQEFYDLFRAILMETGRTEHLERLSANEAHRGTKESISDLLQQSGWSLVQMIEDSFQMRFLDGSAMLNHSLTKLGFLGGWRSVTGADEEREVFELLEKRLNDAAQQNGELRMTVPMLYLEARKAVRGQ